MTLLVLSKNNRFNIRKDFLNLKKTGKMLSSESFGFLYIKGSGQRQSSVPTIKNVGDDFYVVPNSRFNFIVSTKISKKAVERNLIRRRLSEIVREIFFGSERFQTVHYNIKNISGVFLCKKTIVGKKYGELKKEVEVLISKI